MRRSPRTQGEALAVRPDAHSVADADSGGVRQAMRGSPQGRARGLADDEPGWVRKSDREALRGPEEFHGGPRGGACHEEVARSQGELDRGMRVLDSSGNPGAPVQIRREPVLGRQSIEVLRGERRGLRPGAHLMRGDREEEGVKVGAYEAGSGGGRHSPAFAHWAGVKPGASAAVHKLSSEGTGSDGRSSG